MRMPFILLIVCVMLLVAGCSSKPQIKRRDIRDERMKGSFIEYVYRTETDKAQIRVLLQRLQYSTEIAFIEDENVRSETIDTLVMLGLPAAAEMISEFHKAEPAIRLRQLQLLPAAEVIEHLKQNDPALEFRDILGKYYQKRGLDQEPTAQDAEPYIQKVRYRYLLLATLSMMKLNQVIPFMRYVLLYGDAHEQLTAARAIHLFGDRSCVESLIEVLSIYGSAHQKLKKAQVIYVSDDEMKKVSLIELISGRKRDVVLEAATALRRITGYSFGLYQDRASEDILVAINMWQYWWSSSHSARFR